jgi:hypothetical protein
MVLCAAFSSGRKREEKTYCFSVVVVAALDVCGLYVPHGWYVVHLFSRGVIL